MILTNKATFLAPFTADLKNKTKENKVNQRDEAGMDTHVASHGQDSVTHLHFGCIHAVNINVSSLHFEMYIELSFGCVIWLLALIFISLELLCPYVGRLPAHLRQPRISAFTAE